MCLARVGNNTAILQESAPVTKTPSVSLSPTGPVVRNRAADEQDIYATIFRYQFDQVDPERQKESIVYCISIGEKDVDPSDGFMRRFAGHEPPVRKLSECIIRWDVVERRTGKDGIWFQVADIVWMSSTEVTVDGEYYFGNMGQLGERYTVKKENGKWKVTKEEPGTITRRLGATLVNYRCRETSARDAVSTFMERTS
jgi:hypothetical protein